MKLIRGIVKSVKHRHGLPEDWVGKELELLVDDRCVVSESTDVSISLYHNSNLAMKLDHSPTTWKDIAFTCPGCGRESKVLQAIHDLIGLYEVDQIDDRDFIELGELTDLEHRKSENGGFYCGSCRFKIGDDLRLAMKQNPERFSFKEV